MANLDTKNLINQLIKKDDKIEGYSLNLNKFKIIFYKCFYLRLRSKKLITLIELLLPLILFYSSINFLHYFDQISNGNLNFRKLYEINDNKFSSFNEFNNNKLSLIYYDHSSINEQLLKNVLNSISNNFKIRFKNQSLSSLESLKYIQPTYIFIYFKSFNSNLIDYEFKIQATLYDSLQDQFLKFPYSLTNQNIRAYVDVLHESILRFFSNELNSNVTNYELNFKKIDNFNFVKRTDKIKFDDQIFKNYSISLVISFFMSSFFILNSICDEKKTKSYQFLKFNGATDFGIYIGHFLNHFLIWSISISSILIYYFNDISLVLTKKLILIFIIFSLLFLIQLIVFNLLITSLFENYNYAETVFLISIILFNPSFLIGNSDFFSINYFNLAQPLFLQSSFYLIASNLCYKFNFNESLIQILTYKVNEENNFSLLSIILISIIYIIIEWILTIYLIKVNPFGSNLAKPFYYFLMPEYWTNKLIKVDSNSLPKQSEFEDMPADKEIAILVKNVFKSYRTYLPFNKFKVLNDFNFAIYDKQITVLLGHNGAGKTTAISLITGLIPADSGSIIAKNYLVNALTDEFYKILGYCPQENIFYETLTIYENLKIAGILKGVSFNSIDDKILNLVKAIDLQSKLNKAVKTLSGGQKRRLCLAIAIIGYNDILVIDEPTSGLDPENRRKVWDILLELRKHKTILLTTHSMEEADVLGDRIAIMQNGKIKCCGSSMFLKRLYHVGYLLRIELTTDKNNELFEFIKQYLPDAVYENQQSNEHSFRLLSTNNNLNLLIAQLFDKFEEDKIKQKFGIKLYNLTNTLLEDVLIKISLDQIKNQSIDENKIEIKKITNHHPLFNLNKIKGFKLYLNQFKAIFIKRLKLNFSFNTLLLLGLISFPVLLVFISEFLFKIYSFSNQAKIDTFNLKTELPNSEFILLNDDHEFMNQSKNLFTNQQKWLKNEFNLDVVKMNVTNVNDALIKESNRIGNYNFQKKFLILSERITDFKYNFYINYFNLPYSLISGIDLFYRSIIKLISNLDFNINLKYELKLNHISKQFKICGSQLFLFILVLGTVVLMFSFPFLIFIELLCNEQINGALNMQIIAGLSRFLYWFSNLIHDFLLSLIFILIGCILICFIDTNQFLSSNILLLFVIFNLTSVGTILLIYLLINLNLKREFINLIIKIHFIFITTIISEYFYLINFIRAVNSNPYNKNELNLKDKLLSLEFLLKCVSPVYNLVDILYNNFIYNYYNNMDTGILPNLIVKSTYYDLKLNLLAYFIFYLICSLFIYLANRFNNLITILIEYFKLIKKSSNSITESHQKLISIDHLNQIDDENVRKEEELINKLIEPNKRYDNFILIIRNLYKLFGKFVAVNCLNFTVKRGECFGLLGVNGSGKSTTFKMIAALIRPTSGQIFLDGLTYYNNSYKYYERLNYCSQENYTNGLTVLDNLKYFAYLNGIPSKSINELTNTLIDECDLQDYKFKSTDKLSGGTKRRYCTAISLIGKKDLILLDEFTTGVDPVARRNLWKTIEFYKTQLKTSFILTSHSMDEVEKLCNTISIMVQGKIKALGNLLYLKDKYSQGFTITIKINEIKKSDLYLNEIKEKMKEKFNGQAIFKEFYMNTMVFIIFSKIFKWPELFRSMEKIKEDLKLNDYLISETNLEQMFLSFADQSNIDI